MHQWRFTVIAIFSLCLSACHSQPATVTADKSPVACDTAKGVCVSPVTGQQAATAPSAAPKAKLIYFTDPICSACWCIEPQVRKLTILYGDRFETEIHMGGLLPSWEGFNGGGISKPADVAHHWQEMSAHFGMPIDGTVWISDPLSSSYPTCIAVKAAEMQDKHAGHAYLRRLREMVMLERKNIAKWEHLREAAVAEGLDSARFRSDFEGPARVAFESDLQQGRQLGVQGFPCIWFTGAANVSQVYGYAGYQEFEAALKKVCEVRSDPRSPTVEECFSHYPSFTAEELSGITGLSKDKIFVECDRLSKNGMITQITVANTKLYRKVAAR